MLTPQSARELRDSFARLQKLYIERDQTLAKLLTECVRLLKPAPFADGKQIVARRNQRAELAKILPKVVEMLERK